jgi:hypothetical protein
MRKITAIVTIERCNCCADIGLPCPTGAYRAYAIDRITGGRWCGTGYSHAEALVDALRTERTANELQKSRT